jgi:hypothetical protein
MKIPLEILELTYKLRISSRGDLSGTMYILYNLFTVAVVDVPE